MLIHRIKLTNLLSFGPDSAEVELGPLNVLIGPNGSGKSNFIDAIGLLKSVPEDLEAGIVNMEYGTVQVFLLEGDVTFSASRPSDGAMRYLSILAVLCDPSPPPLVCLEEPELGLHPDILPSLADLLREASERCQPIVTTHSDVFVDKLTHTPESIVIWEKHQDQAQWPRLEKGDLAHWLKECGLGTLWTKDEYRKGRDSFAILGRIDPREVIEASPYASQLVEERQSKASNGSTK